MITNYNDNNNEIDLVRHQKLYLTVHTYKT